MIKDFESLQPGDYVPEHIVEYYDWSCLSCFFTDPDLTHYMIYQEHWWDDEMQRWNIELVCASCENTWIENVEVE